MPGGFTRQTLRYILVAALVTHAAGAPPPRPPAALKWVVPADIDQTVPAVHLDNVCPLPEILSGASGRVRELVANFHRVTARERIEIVEISRKGSPHRARKISFNYVAQINQDVSGSPSVEEYRTSTNANDSAATGMVDTGTAAFALIFHPYYVEDFVMSCEGLTEIGLRPAWQLHFSQHPNRNNLFHVYRVSDNYYPAKLKGRAWIAADNYEVLRLQTDLVEPIGQIHLQREHSDTRYGLVEFGEQKVRLWLPQNAELYMDFRGHRFQRRHSFSSFQLFKVETGEQIKGLKASRKK